MVVILQKMVMTGAMCVVAQGSSVQLLIAILVMLSYMLLVLKTAPYEEDSEDWSAFVACVALTLTTIGGFALMTDNQNARTYESKVLGLILIGINGVCIALEIIIVVVFDCDGFSRCKKICGGGKVKNSTQITPIEHPEEHHLEDLSEHVLSVQDTLDLHEREIDRMHKEHDEHNKRLKQKHEAMRQKSSSRVQDRIRARAALRQSKTLQKTEMFKDLAADSILQIIKAMDFRSFDKSEHLVQQGEDASEFMVIMKGAATVFRDGKEVRRFGILDFLGEGALVNEGHTRGATVTANMPTQVLVLTRERYEELKMDGTIAQATHERARSLSTRYNVQDAERLAAGLALNAGGGETNTIVEENETIDTITLEN